MRSFNSFYAFSLAAGLLFLHSPATRAEPVIEWKFDQTEEIAGNSTVKMDRVREGAKGEGLLMPASTVTAATTGIGKGWQPFLASGFLEVQRGSGESGAGQHGLATDTKAADSTGANYSAYMGFSGAGDGDNADGTLQGGTVYLVISPTEWVTGARFGIFGTGHAGEGAITLGITKQGALALRVGTQQESASAALEGTWNPGAWYFIAGTWRQDEPLLLYVREMGSSPADSPEAQTVTSQNPAPQVVQPKYDPFAIGANWYNPGANASTNDGSNSRIAWARIDNQKSTQAEIDAVFQSLGARN